MLLKYRHYGPWEGPEKIPPLKEGSVFSRGFNMSVRERMKEDVKKIMSLTEGVGAVLTESEDRFNHVIEELIRSLKVYEATLWAFRGHESLKPLLARHKKDFGAHEVVLKDLAKVFGRDAVAKAVSSVGKTSQIKGTNPVTSIASAIRGVISVANDLLRSRSKDLQKIAKDILSLFSDLEGLLYPEPPRKGSDYRWPHIMDYKNNFMKMADMETFISEKNIPKKGTSGYHQHKIAVDTVKNPLKGKFLGGPTEKEAIDTLKRVFGYSDSDVRKLQKETQDECLFGVVSPLLEKVLCVLEEFTIAPGMEFEDDYGIWKVERKARGTTDSWEIWLTTRGKGHTIVVSGHTLKKFYKKLK